MNSGKTKDIKLIDIEKVFQKKNPQLLKLIPKFIINYLKRIIHQEELNDILINHNDKLGLKFTQACMEDFKVDCQIVGLNNLPKEGRYLFASNHPLGGFDGIIFMHTVGQRFPNLKFPVNDILLHIDNLKPLFAPVNKHGGHSREAASQLNTAFNSDDQILIFPAGLVSRKINGKITDLEWKKSFIKKAIQSERDIVPVFISGKNSNFFYRLSKIRKTLGIKANIEMLYLVDELFKHKGKKFTITFGEPIPWQTLTKKHSHAEWAEKIKQKTYGIAKLS